MSRRRSLVIIHNLLHDYVVELTWNDNYWNVGWRFLHVVPLDLLGDQFNSVLHHVDFVLSHVIPFDFSSYLEFV